MKKIMKDGENLAQIIIGIGLIISFAFGWKVTNSWLKNDTASVKEETTTISPREEPPSPPVIGEYYLEGVWHTFTDEDLEDFHKGERKVRVGTPCGLNYCYKFLWVPEENFIWYDAIKEEPFKKAREAVEARILIELEALEEDLSFKIGKSYWEFWEQEGTTHPEKEF